ncbi:MAG TPA: multiheme c-type cytochrome [Terracidiphilus sp.]
MSRPRMFLLCLLLIAVVLLLVRPYSAATEAAAQESSSDPNAVCAPCHKEIYERYRSTPMANASGLAGNGFLPADFVHAPSGVHYRVFEEAGKVWLSYERDDPARPLNGRQQLRYYLGSGRRGRTYLFEQQGYWFEAPINWYAKQQLWDMAPAFQEVREMPLTLPVDPGCLHCHASGAAGSQPEARNRYAGAPFAYGGITCEACHGDADAHLASAGRIRMIDISGLEPVRRDSICLNCHLEGQAGVNREDKRPEDFRPGDNLFDYSVFFVHRGESGSGGRATSQWEALLRSQCKQKSGQKLTCTSCHDAHGDPAPEQRVEFYRGKCLQCHSQTAFATRHHAENRDCTECHMARPPSNDIAHEQVTDHWIRKRVSGARLPPATMGDLVSVGGIAADDRDLGLAYAQLAESGDSNAAPRALELLLRAEQTAAGAPRDHELHAEAGFLEQVAGKREAAAREYREALTADPDDSLAAGNLALIEAEARRFGAAAELWREVIAHNPAELEAGLNLAVLECRAGEPGSALETLDATLQFAPDNDRARAMAAEIRTAQRVCRDQRDAR